mmetsp:Transcript_80617/g.126980  ORF Transcript_80617/g.126980 Transcript_80617/m.126980 type:complete len:482 (+) Transcript_80617:82-1527(+)
MQSALAIVPYEQNDPVVAIKPYCGAKNLGPIEDFNLSSEACKVYRSPAPAWADVGIVNHMQEAVVPELATTAPGTSHLKPRFQAARCLFRFSVVLLSIAENILCYLAYFQVGNPEDSFYNKFEAYMLGYPGLDDTLLVFSLINTCYMFSFWMLIGVANRDLYGSMTTGRLLISLPIGGMCTAMVFFGEETNVFPLVCASCVLLHLVVWATERCLICLDKEQPIHAYCYFALIFIVCCWLISFILTFLIDSAGFLYDSECPATTNKAMPVRINGVTERQCVKWGVPLPITRTPSLGSSTYDALCSTSFHAFTTVADNGDLTPSSAAHYVRCPSYCQSLGLSGPVVGCHVYSATSSICSAALQMGILQSNVGGVVKVIGRPSPQAYQRCNQNGILSTDPTPTTNIQFPQWAFYFQVAETADLDMITIHSWRKKGTPGAQEPWKSYVADVTWIVGGTSQRREVELGPNSGDIEVNFCRGSKTCE